MTEPSNPPSAHYIWLYVSGATFLGSLALSIKLDRPLAWLVPIVTASLFLVRLAGFFSARRHAADAAARNARVAR